MSARRAWLRVVSAVLALAASLAFVGSAPAQERELAYRRDDQVLCRLRCAAYPGSTTANGAGFVRIEVENEDRVEHRVVVTLQRLRVGHGGCDVRVASTFALAPQQRATAFLPLPRPLSEAELLFDVDGAEVVDPIHMPQADGLVALLLADRPDAAPVALARLQELAVATPTVVACRGDEAPADWRLYTGFDAVVVDGRTRLSGEVQEALRRAACAGATVVVAGPAALPAGELRQIASTARAGAAAHGLGRVIAMMPLDASPAAQGAVLRGLAPVVETVASAEVVLGTQPVPGLGEPPLAGFVLVIVLFAVLVGPVNFLLLRRWRRPLLALVTVPVLGFGTTLAILGYGLLHDGFGVRGVTTSWTWLDQERHEAAVLSLHTLFAGRSPAALTMGPDTLLLAARASQRPGGAPDRWHFDPANALLDGGALPSRTPTPLLARQHGAARERLLAQRTPEGTLRLVTDAGVVPSGLVVLCDLDGDYWVGQSPLLQRVAPADADLALVELARSGQDVHVQLPPEEPRRGFGGSSVTAPEQRMLPVAVALARRLFTFPLPRGTWVAQLERAPWLDQHGLTIRHDLQRHFARGRMQAEDFVP